LDPGPETSFYRWAEVAQWLRHAGSPMLSEEPVLAAMNLALQLRHLVPRLTRIDSCWTTCCATRRTGQR